jgi:hypothetical protein
VKLGSGLGSVKVGISFIHLFYFIYIPWMVRGKSHLDTGIVNIDTNTTTQKCTYNMNTTWL